MANKTHFDVVGSFLRPAELKKARADFEAGSISKEEFTEIKHNLIKELVEKQKAAGRNVHHRKQGTCFPY